MSQNSMQSELKIILQDEGAEDIFLKIQTSPNFRLRCNSSFLRKCFVAEANYRKGLWRSTAGMSILFYSTRTISNTTLVHHSSHRELLPEERKSSYSRFTVHARGVARIRQASFTHRINTPGLRTNHYTSRGSSQEVQENGLREIYYQRTSARNTRAGTSKRSSRSQREGSSNGKEG